MEPAGLPLRPHSAAPSLAPVPHYTDLGLEAGGGQLSPGPGYHEAAVRRSSLPGPGYLGHYLSPGEPCVSPRPGSAAGSEQCEQSPGPGPEQEPSSEVWQDIVRQLAVS